ncbi:c-type cytochrome [Dyella choica]|uniref:C-type cytochrome n=2 Tax=Dyella choica TaxID=1927959 RepID=A0A3S0RM04_9GAMM|nr:c-type cytochrome [Dyella choica]
MLPIVAGRLHAQSQSSVTASDSTATRVMACTACHGERGQGSGDDYFPRLAGKPAGYLYNQLVAFRDGQRKYPPMNYLLAYLPDTYLQEMADYFATQQAPFPALPKPTVGPQVLAQGKKLVLQGDDARHIPACVACHGASLTGMSPDMPGLLGLHSKYISAQLGASRYGTRTSSKPNCMQQLTMQLSEADITAVSAYLSSLPAPANPAPAPAGSLKLALTCEGARTK